MPEQDRQPPAASADEAIVAPVAAAASGEAAGVARVADDDAEHVDALPDDLNAHELVGPYLFPDNSRRRIPGAIYLVMAAGCLLLWLLRRSHGPVLVNRGFVLAALLLGAVGLFAVTSGWRMQLDEKQALTAATAAVGFPVGHASAQLAWRGLRSRPTWRILCYSTEEPPKRRGFVLVDAVDGRIVEHLAEDNPETDWVEPEATPGATPGASPTPSSH